jgi:transglutaminase-like putative cysteine protease
MILFFLAACLPSAGSVFASQDYGIQAPASWIETIVFAQPSDVPEEAVTYGTHYLLQDIQIKVEAEAILYFHHSAERMINHKGIEDMPSIEIDHHPANEKIILHSVKIYRNNKIINQLYPKNIKVLQREERLEKNLYSGRKSLHIFLEDVRVGDVIDYSYTIVDTAKNRQSDFFHNVRLHGYVPLYHLRSRLLWPKAQPLAIKNHATDIKPVVRDLDHYTEYTWDCIQRAILPYEKHTPGWFYPFPWVEVRSQKSWHDVALENMAFYKEPALLSDDLDQFIKAIANKHKTSGDQFIAVMRFVQDEIRYLALNELNESCPTDPAVVFQRRFGDCKDKSFLAITLLRKLGIEAYPAYVNTVDDKSIIDFLPSLAAFDHAIVVAYIEGKKYWIDATHTFQRGSLKHYAQPDYGYALILNAKTTALTKMPQPTLLLPSKEIEETFDLRQRREAPAKFIIKTTYRRSVADNFREYIHTTTRKELQKSWIDYYREMYPSIQSPKEAVIKDDIDLNQMTIIEEYEIPQAWERDEENKRWHFNYYAQEINPYLRDKSFPHRTTPFTLPYPINFAKKIIILLPAKKWELSAKKLDVTGPGFNYRVQDSLKDITLSVSHTFKTLKDHITPGEFDLYTKNIKSAKENMDWQLFDYDEQPITPKDYLNWPIIVLLVLATLCFIFIAYKIYHYSFKQPLPPIEPTPHKGIGGWLIIIGLQLFALVIIFTMGLYEDLTVVLSLNQWVAITDPTASDFQPLHSLLLVIETSINLLFIIVFCLLIILFFKHKRLFIPFYIIAICSAIVIEAACNISTIAILNQGSLQDEIIFYVMAACKAMVWIWYITESKRARATFIKA